MSGRGHASMTDDIENTAYRLMLELVSIPSVSPSAQKETEIARFIHTRLAREQYFRDNPEDLRLIECRNDPLKRYCLFALVRSARQTERTVLLTGHMDVVDTQVYGPLQDLAFDPERLTRRIGRMDLPDEARKDLESGEWLFGRGVSDMKTSVAIELAYLMKAAENRGALPSNLAVLIVPDEENNSQGMIDAVPYLRRMQEEEGLRFLACINMEPTVGSAQNAGPTIHMGSIGKINPFFFCLGRETHVGEYYQGLSAAPIVSRINLMLDGNTDYMDEFNGISYLPWGCMRQHDLRQEYSASIMFKAVAFYSYLTVTKYPGDILNEMRHIAERALAETLDRHRVFSARFNESRGSASKAPRWTPKVLSFEQLCAQAAAMIETPIPEIAERISREAPDHFDERDKALRLVERLVEACGLQGPLVVLGFLPPYYPHRGKDDQAPADRALKAAIHSAVSAVWDEHAVAIETVDFFEGVSDLSYCGFAGDPLALEPIAYNLPGWGIYYTFPIDDLAAVRIPIVNIGPVGRDAHKMTERVHVSYAMRTLPAVIDTAVRCIGDSP